MSGKFIVIEGLEGAGKSSAIASVVTHLQAKGIQAETVREPGGTPLAESLRDLVKKKWDEKVSPTTELLLMYASRVQLVDNVVKPALAKNRWVIQKVRKITLGRFKPDLTILLDVEEKKGLERARERGELDRIEEEDLAFFQRTRQAYLNIAAKDPSIIVIDANQSMLDVHQAILRTIEEHLF
ncbi:MAG: dTMP kinase [Idiomarina sp.]|nr:dTMP kinase [Idiomarina sp.]